MAKLSKNAKSNQTVTRVDNEERDEALKAALAAIDKKFGAGSIMFLGKAPEQNITVIPTGIFSIDLALGVGGLPRGRIIEIYGPESSGKTTVALHCIASAQKAGGIAAIIDAEHALSPEYAQALGVNIADLVLSQPNNGEEALEIVDHLVRSGSVDIVVVDSVAALVPRAEIEGEMGDSSVGLQARLMSQALRKLTASISQSKTIVIFINQLREKIGVMFGNPETTTGGRALKFYSSVRMDIRKGEVLKEGDTPIGARTRCKITKNKVAPPFKEATFDVIYGKGVINESCVVDVAVEHNIINKSGAWFSYKEERLGQGRDKAVKYLIDNPAVCEEIIAEVKDKIAEDNARLNEKLSRSNQAAVSAAGDAAKSEQATEKSESNILDDILELDEL